MSALLQKRPNWRAAIKRRFVPIDGLIGLPACGQLKNLGAALQADGETRSALRPQASEGEAQHGLFCWTRPVGQGNEHLHCG